MTESELAKVRELVASQRELLSLWLHGDEKATEAMMERRRRAFLAVEAMVAEHQTDGPQS